MTYDELCCYLEDDLRPFMVSVRATTRPVDDPACFLLKLRMTTNSPNNSVTQYLSWERRYRLHELHYWGREQANELARQLLRDTFDYACELTRKEASKCE